jgi:hypothetical protein
MKFIRSHWYDIGGIVAIGALVYFAFAWQDMLLLQRLLLLNFVGMLIHQFEEYGWPGGEPAVMNLVMQPSSTPDRYPLNQNAAMIVNILFAYVLHLVPVFFPNIIWLGLAPMLSGMVQFAIHGIAGNLKLRTIYNPGLGAVLLFHIPLGIYYLYIIHSTGMVSGWDWVIGLVYMFLWMGIVLYKMTYDWLADKNSPYPFTEAEMKKWNVQGKMERLKR